MMVPMIAGRGHGRGSRAEAVDGELPASDPVLVGRLRAEIAATGPITFARFMSIAQADPERGYYATSDERQTRAGDFLTAPELHPIFGATLARVAEEMWRAMGRPARFALREYGAGSGRLAIDLLGGLEADGSGLLEALRYEPLELVPARVQRIGQRLTEAGFEHVLRDSASPVGVPAVLPADSGCVIANEFLDALPVHRLVARDGRLLETFVGWEDQGDEETGGRFVDVVDEPSTPALAERLAAENVALADGQRAEVCLELDAWAEEMSGALEAGYAVILDYGRPAGELYGPSRPDGTLRAYSGHRVHDDPFVAIGRQDLTAHVDFTAVERAAAAHAWRTLGLTTQAEFLVGAGLAELLAARRSEPTLSAKDYLALRASVARLLDPLALGGFRVLVLGRDVPADARLAGLGYRVRG